MQGLFPGASTKYCSNVLLARSHMFPVDYDYSDYALVPFMDLLMTHDGMHKGQARLYLNGADVYQDLGESQNADDHSGSIAVKKEDHQQHQQSSCSSVVKKEEDHHQHQQSSCSYAVKKEDHQQDPCPSVVKKEEHEENVGLLDDLEALEETGVNFYDQHSSDEQNDFYEVVLTRSVKQGEMIRYDYRPPQSSSSMLVRHGFCYPDTGVEYESFSVTRDMIFATCVNVVQYVMHGKQPMTLDVAKRASDHVQERFQFYCDYYRYLSFAFTRDYNIIVGIFNTSLIHRFEKIHDRYWAYNGRYENDLLLLLHIVFANDALFSSYQANTFAATRDLRKNLALINDQASYCDGFSRKRVRRDPQVEQLQRLVYTACRDLSYSRRACYEKEDNHSWTPPEVDEYQRQYEVGLYRLLG